MPPRVAPRFNVGDTNQPITEWSITLGKRQSDVPSGWLNRLETYSRLRAANEAITSDGAEPQGLVGPAGRQAIFPETESQGQEPDLPEISMHDLADLEIAEDDQVDEDAELYDSD